MEVRVEFAGRQPTPLRGKTEQRVRFALRRLHWLVPVARIRLADVNGPRGGLDKQCRVQLDLAGDAPIVVTSLARDWPQAINLSVQRAAHALGRFLRRKTHSRSLRHCARAQ